MPNKKGMCYQWGSNPRLQKKKRTWVSRLRPLGHDSSAHLQNLACICFLHFLIHHRWSECVSPLAWANCEPRACKWLPAVFLMRLAWCGQLVECVNAQPVRSIVHCWMALKWKVVEWTQQNLLWWWMVRFHLSGLYCDSELTYAPCGFKANEGLWMIGGQAPTTRFERTLLNSNVHMLFSHPSFLHWCLLACFFLLAAQSVLICAHMIISLFFVLSCCFERGICWCFVLQVA